MDQRTLWLPKGVVKQETFDIHGSTLFRVNNFQNILAIKLILFFNVLTNCLYILDLIQKHIFQLYFSWIKEKLRKKQCRGYLSSAWDPRTHWLPKGVLKQELFDIQWSTFFGVNNFQNIWAIKLILFFKMCKIWCRFEKWKRNTRNCFWFLRLLRLN